MEQNSSKDDRIWNMPRKTLYGNPFYPEENWRSHKGWQNAANKIARLLEWNEKLQGHKYTHHLIIGHKEVLAPVVINGYWERMQKALFRLGIVAYGHREPTKKNTVHYHLLALECPASEAKIKKVLGKICPLAIRLNKIGQDNGVAEYIAKVFKKDKRIAFADGIGLRRQVIINGKAFWKASKEAINGVIADNEKRITKEWLAERPELAKQIAEYIWCDDDDDDFRMTIAHKCRWYGYTTLEEYLEKEPLRMAKARGIKDPEPQPEEDDDEFLARIASYTGKTQKELLMEKMGVDELALEIMEKFAT